MNFFKKTEIIKFLLIFVISFSSLGASYEFVPVESVNFVNSSNHYEDSSGIDREAKLINKLIAALQEQNKSLVGSSSVEESNRGKKCLEQGVITENGKLKKSAIFLGDKTLKLGKFIGVNFLDGLKGIFAKGLRRAGSLSIYLPIAAFTYWRITGRSPIIPVKEAFRFSKFLMKEIFVRRKLLADEEVKSNWVYKFNEIWETPMNWIFGKENSADYVEKFSPNEIFYGGSALLAYLIFFR